MVAYALDSRARWSDPASFSPNWDRRAALAATFIAPGSSVLDVGCGKMALRRFLPAGCAYTPADLTKWSSETIQVDLDTGEYPSGRYDVAVMLGLLTYLQHPLEVLTRARAGARELVVSFAHPRLWISRTSRERRGWINHFRPRAFSALLGQAGWRIEERRVHSSGTRHFTVVYRAV